MELHKENLLGNMQAVGGAFLPGFMMLLMPGAAPTTPEQVKAFMDVYDIQDMYAKSVGVAQLLQTKTIAEGASFNLAPSGIRSALKGGEFDYGFAAATNSLVPADLRKASLPDRFFFCSKDAPFARLTEKTGMAGINMMRACPWQFYDTTYSAVYPGVGNHPDSIATYVTEFEWNTPHNFGGILRSGTAKLGASNGYTIIVEAWNPDTQLWDVVVTATAKAGAVASNYVAFSKRISTTKLRVQTTVTGTWSVGTCFYPHGIIPLEVAADVPAPVAVADIGWVVLLPMSGYHQSLNTQAGAPATFNDTTGPVPFYVAKAGEVAGNGVEILLTKTTGLMSTDKPNMVATTKYLAANIKE